MTEPILTGHKGFTVRGPATHTRNSDERDPDSARIPALWQMYLDGGGAAAVKGALDAPVTVAVYTKYEGDQDGAYTLVVGAPLLDSSEPQLEHKTVDVPDGSYLLFESKGDMPMALVETWRAIHEYFDDASPYSRVYAADFEIHDATTPNQVDVYIGVR